MQIIASILYIIFIAAYIFLIVSINSQVQKYLLPGDSAKNILYLFTFGSALLLVISIILFLTMPWNEIFNATRDMMPGNNFDNFFKTKL